ncbi:MAG: NAD(P)-binding protein, partial [Rubrivivax sp.]
MARLAVIGAGWAGLAAAVRATADGHAVSVFEMAAAPGGRARSIEHDGETLDNGQHILIGAYRDTLALMRQVGVDPEQVLHRLPLALIDPFGQGLRLAPGPAPWALAGAVMAHRGWSWAERFCLLRAGLGWGLRRFSAPEGQTVQALCSGLGPAVYHELVEPLCVAALNTPAREASARVFLRVLRDGLLGDRGCADLLLPRRPLGELLPEPAWAWLQARGARLVARTRVASIGTAAQGGWMVRGDHFNGVVLACTAQEAA